MSDDDAIPQPARLTRRSFHAAAAATVACTWLARVANALPSAPVKTVSVPGAEIAYLMADRSTRSPTLHTTGWMFDDEMVYYPAPYERLGAAAKAGSPSRLLSWNPWITPRGTDFQDFQFGEGFLGSPDLPVADKGIWPEGPVQGLHAHGNFQIDGPNWGITQPDTVIEPPHDTPDKAIQIAMQAAERDEALSWNLLMYADGSVSPASLQLLRRMGRAVRARYPIG
jgi:hypothetical protein